MRRLNRYVEEQAPWKQAKAGEDAALDATLWDLTEGLRLLTVLLHPFMPSTAAEMSARIGMPAGSPWPGSEAAWGRLPAGLRVVAGASLFPRIEE